MQWLAAICVRRPVFASVLILLLTVIGAFGYMDLGVDRFPKIDFPFVTVTTILPGAAPEEVESEISEKIEAAVNTISGIDELRSLSVEGVSQVYISFQLEKNVDVAAQEVRDKVALVLGTLPQGIEPPTVMKMDPDAVPVLTLAVSSDKSTRDITEFVDKRLRRQLESLGGVGEIVIVGGRKRQVNLWLLPDELRKWNLTALEVTRALATQNVEIPTGRIEQADKNFTLRLRGRADSVAGLEELVVATRDSAQVRLRDVARIEDGMEEAESVGYLRGQSAVLLLVRKQSGTNTIEVIKNVKSRLEEIRPSLPPGFTIEVARDQSEFIINAVNSVKEHLALGAVFAAIIVLLFLANARSTAIAAIAIPTSIISTFALMKWAGFTLNVITLLALTLAVGIVIDDAIVVLENIYRRMEEKGENRWRAAVEGTREIGLAVLATTLSLVAVFLPVAFMSGIVGRFMNSFGLTMAFSIMVSLLVSFTLTPMLSARWLGTHHAGASTKSSKQSFFYGPIERVYMAMLRWSMGHRWAIILVCVAALFATVPLFGIAAKNFLPNEDDSQFAVTVRAPEGTSLEGTRLIATRIANQVQALPGVMYALTTIGDDAQRTANLAQVYVKLVPADKRKDSSFALIDRARKLVLADPASKDLRVSVGIVPAFSGGGVTPAAIQFMVQGPELGTIAAISERLVERLRKTKGVVDPDSSLVLGKPEVRAVVDRKKAADLGVSIADIAQSMRLLVGGYKVSAYSERGEQYAVFARAIPESRADSEVLKRLSVPSMKLGSVTLDNVVTFEKATGPSRIDRYSRQKQVTISANLEVGYSQAAVLGLLESEVKAMKLGPGYSAGATGQSRELGRAMKNFLLAFMLSGIFMYLVLAAQFESWLHPITILLSLPLTVPFAIFSIVVTGQSVNIFSMLGILVLFGIVKKNSILQIDHTIKLRAAGLDRQTAILEANRDRLRPILMTTAAFVAGMVPLVVSSGAGAGTNRATGFVIMGGQTLALLLTLLATPVAYSLFDDMSVRLSKLFGRKQSPSAEPSMEEALAEGAGPSSRGSHV